MKVNLRKIDWIFLSQNEPNADQNCAHASNINPKLRRLNGSTNPIKGSGTYARSNHFIAIDAGVTLTEVNILDFGVNIPARVDLVEFSAFNPIIGLNNNSGIRIWKKTSAENYSKDSSPEQRVISCNDTLGAVVLNNSTPEHAYQYSYNQMKELLKTSTKLGINNLLSGVGTLAGSRKIKAFLSIGADVENGEWSMLGARNKLIEFLSNKELKMQGSNLEDTKAELALLGISCDNLSPTLSTYIKTFIKAEQTTFDKRISFGAGSGKTSGLEPIEFYSQPQIIEYLKSLKEEPNSNEEGNDDSDDPEELTEEDHQKITDAVNEMTDDTTDDGEESIEFYSQARKWTQKWTHRFRTEVHERVKWAEGEKKRKEVLGPKPFWGW